MNITSASDPRWTSEAHTAIELLVVFEGETESVRFTAAPLDIEEHSRTLFALAVAGEFGVVAEYVPPTPEQIEAAASARRDAIGAVVADVDNPIRAALLVVLDEFNRTSAVARAMLAAAAAATTLADFKTRMGQIQGIPARVPSDLLDAVRGKLGV